MKTLNDIIIELWHISRTALAGKDCGRYERMIYIKRELNRTYPNHIKGLNGKQVWFAIEEQTSITKYKTK